MEEKKGRGKCPSAEDRVMADFQLKTFQMRDPFFFARSGGRSGTLQFLKLRAVYGIFNNDLFIGPAAETVENILILVSFPPTCSFVPADTLSGR
jgi:hypothetical protein